MFKAKTLEVIINLMCSRCLLETYMSQVTGNYQYDDNHDYGNFCFCHHKQLVFGHNLYYCSGNKVPSGAGTIIIMSIAINIIGSLSSSVQTSRLADLRSHFHFPLGCYSIVHNRIFLEDDIGFAVLFVHHSYSDNRFALIRTVILVQPQK